MGPCNKGDCFVSDLFNKSISQLEKEISRKGEINSFLTKQLSLKNTLRILCKTRVKKGEV